MSNRKRTDSNRKSTIFGITIKTKKYKTIRAPGTEVGRRTEGETSVQNGENGRPGRKSVRVQGVKLPYQMPKTGARDGSLRTTMENSSF